MAAVTLTLRLSMKPRIGTFTPPVAGGGEIVGDAVALVAEDEREARQPGEILGHQIAIGVRRHQAPSPLAQHGDGGGGLAVGHHVDPFLRPARHRRRREERLLPLDDMQRLHPEGLAGADDRRAVVRIVGRVEGHGDRGEARVDHRLDPLAPAIEHQRLEHRDDALDLLVVAACPQSQRRVRSEELVGRKHARGPPPHGGVSTTGRHAPRC